jgi:predicted protein tyrosine phosphatase
MPSPTEPRRVLFICQLNRARSATAERLFGKRPGLEVVSAGTSEDALVRVNARMLEWADVIFTMDGGQQRDLERQFPGHDSLGRTICLDIPDDYGFLQPELVELLEERVEAHLKRLEPEAPSS